MGKAKWIGGFLGILSGGPIGALAGFILGALFDAVADDNGLEGIGGNGSPEGTYTGAEYGNDNYQRDYSSQRMQEGTRNGFLFSLLTLASYIIKADSKIMHSEMEAMRQFLRMNFGETAVNEGYEIMLKLFERQKQMESVQPGSYRQTIIDACHQLRSVLTNSQRLQLLSLLATVAKADGRVVSEEIAALREVTQHLGLSESELNSMLNLGATTLKDAYAVLEIDETATDEEVRAAYKRMVVKHHPDRVASLGEDVRMAAERKMREINEAKELIYKARGL
ncbi:MAG: TerB family tellurite resistance protein [Bacteroidales bacterium]|nr:TerB family tellurite resistance protein [Bacteroidales bacterium]